MEVERADTSSSSTTGLKRLQEEQPDSSASPKRFKMEEEEQMQTDAAPVGGNDRTKDGGGAAKPKGGKQRAPNQKKDQTYWRKGTHPEGSESRNSEEPKAPRLPKRHCALLIGFCGSGFNGMQIQPDPKLRTIEGVLFDTLVKVGAVSQDNADNSGKVKLGRAARTDAGVHAAGNVVSMMLITAIPNLVARMNEELPPEIRLWNILRVQKSFDARSTCDSRKYTYFFPSYLMIPSKPGSSLHQTLQQNGTEQAPHPFWTDSKAETTVKDDLRRKRVYRMPPELVERLRVAAKKFEKSHNFHNFTVRRDFRDRSCMRHILSVQVADPVVYGDTEWVSVLFHGQSFMLHQIRKMMSALVLASRTGSPPQIIEELYGPRMVFMPKMPALGLLLEYPIFDTYTKKIAIANAKYQPADPEYRPSIDFEVHREAIDQFKRDYIYSRMRGIEDAEGVFDAWIRSVDAYAGNDLLYLNSKGVIPSAAVIKKGERRANPFKERKRFDATTFADRSADDKIDISEEEAEEEGEEMSLDKAQLDEMDG
ncbi:tRNA pseudouridine synthase [Laetiporus sulphureus 93-53]|uniref:tRNA pseudouridine synthase n=1 Tax=Laetiporus sulphureus 93-53 TaxID=1314785 RepID=A0A165GCF7_9APHY|nr:tRNA pseudouridine synthase [Laetiporus sulphureus 93-53]KZT10155.1 tRNA pseudouridine synthase [Laetiporus sulphureus 93-53]